MSFPSCLSITISFTKRKREDLEKYLQYYSIFIKKKKQQKITYTIHQSIGEVLIEVFAINKTQSCHFEYIIISIQKIYFIFTNNQHHISKRINITVWHCIMSLLVHFASPQCNVDIIRKSKIYYQTINNLLLLYLVPSAFQDTLYGFS